MLGLKQKLYDYQEQGVNFLSSTGGRAILADAPGVGKTAQALAFVVSNNIAKTLVICPASVKFAWENEVHKWTKLKAFVIDGSFINLELEAVLAAIDAAEIVIVNYDLLRKYLKLLSNIRFDCLVLDEFHYIKNRSQRTQAAQLIARKIPRILLLSGTPMLNRPVELFNGLQLVDPRRWNSWYAYVNKYCAAHKKYIGRGRQVLDVSGSSNLDELRQKIQPYFLRRTKAEVLKELPPKNFITIPVLIPPDIQKLYDKAEKSLAQFLRDDREKTSEEIKRAMNAEKLVRLSELRQITTSGKMAMAEDLIDQLLEDDEKVIVFSVYNAPLESLANRYKARAVTLTGTTPVQERGRLIGLFQTDPGVQVFLGGTKAAGIGITLTAASNVVFIDYDFVPAIMEQAADRAHRIGQEAESVNIYQLYAKDTIDDWMADILKEKQALVDRLIEGKPAVSEEHVVQTLFRRVEEKHQLLDTFIV